MAQKKAGKQLGFLLAVVAGSTAYKAESESVMSGQATVRALTGLLHDLTDEEILELTESSNRPGLKEFLLARKMEKARNASVASVISVTHFLPLTDSQVPPIHQPTILRYRTEATRQGVPVSTPLCYRVAKGYMLKTHAPQAGPCRKNFQYLQDWNFEDNPTEDCMAFWISRLVPGSINKTVDEQKTLLAEFRQRLDLPAHHCSSFGSVALLSGLILAHYKAIGERVPLNGFWVRTDSCLAGGYRLYLYWYSDALYCDYWDWADGRRDAVGLFALGVETLGS